jgi:hypothetical protein
MFLAEISLRRGCIRTKCGRKVGGNLMRSSQKKGALTTKARANVGENLREGWCLFTQPLGATARGAAALQRWRVTDR